MVRIRLLVLGVCAATVALVGCDTKKSANPLSASVAGPIPGVNITAPTPVQPNPNAQLAVDQQPVTLMVDNATTTGVRPLTYTFEVATDADFTNKVFSRGDVAPGEGRTSLKLPDPLATGRAYYWRARAQDGANTGPYSGGRSFSVFTPIVIQAPVLASPVSNVRTDNQHPTFQWTNAPRSGPVGAITYILELSKNDSFTDMAAIWQIAELPNQTSFTAPGDLGASTQYFWHVRGADPSTIGPWSATAAFQTPAPPAPPPPPPPSGGGGGGGGSTGPAPNDAIDLHTATILNSPADLANWPATAKITLLDIRPNGIHVEFTKQTGRGRWPDVTPPGWDGPLQFTLGMVLTISGRVYASAPIQFWYGRDEGGGPPSQYALNWFYDPARWAPMTYHQPAVGEMIGFFVGAGDLRNHTDSSGSPVRERSNVVMVPMPSDAGATFRY